ncbi:hypothetical protein POTOM_048434 [Populus tomentosa]|uniref:CCT domain-containing protein n=1 Tax=Populus tomentosa TaxID=118781 RepID=A0A8X7Y8U6_POPTO|nr:hypothetical protein POTOM_048434 [Populus tomentosa]
MDSCGFDLAQDVILGSEFVMLLWAAQGRDTLVIYLSFIQENGEAANQASFPSTLPGSNVEESCAVPETEFNISDSASHINDGHEAEPQPSTIGTSPALPNVGTHELSSQERDSAISRYKEKKQTRRYDKRIRYESRKVRADSRIRIKGRFAKLDH